AIDSASVHHLHSGQVILDLQGCLKELLENALDSGANQVEVRIRDHGLEGIEVSDNGSGIKEDDWEFIALKHHTSKLPDLASLPLVETFGFRGEALSALCALSESMTVVTATKETAPMGAIIKLGRDGKVLDSTGRVARPRGTTVTITGLFTPLPVRRKEFERTSKREFSKALSLLTAYALVPSVGRDGKGIRIKVESLPSGKSGKRSTLLSTDGRGSLRSSVINIWGPKALEGVLDIHLEVEVSNDRPNLKRQGAQEMSHIVKVDGLISTAAWGQGRSSPDRQYFYVNGRPCDLSKVGRAINEVYKSFNTHQVPLAILDFTLPPMTVDINVSPDKRTVFLHSEMQLVEALRVKGGEVVPSLMPRNPRTRSSQDHSLTPFTLNEDEEGEPELSQPPPKRSRVQLIDNTTHNSRKPSTVTQTLRTSTAIWSPERKAKSSQSQNSDTGSKGLRSARAEFRDHLKAYASQGVTRDEGTDSEDGEEEVVVIQPTSLSLDTGEDEDEESVDERSEKPILEGVGIDEASEDVSMDSDMDEEQSGSVLKPKAKSRRLDEPIFEDEGSDQLDDKDFDDEHTATADTPLSRDHPRPSAFLDSSSIPIRPPPLQHGSTPYRSEIQSTISSGELSLSFNYKRLQSRYPSRRTSLPISSASRDVHSALRQGGVTSAAGINNHDASSAEAALSRVISKVDFEDMEVLGQFNKGFIIARLRRNESDDLFIIDQHASDEKYNFETLQRTTIIKAQKLIKPRSLQLTAGDEITAMEHLDVLRNNGFEVKIVEDAPPGRGERVLLSAMPVSKETTFDVKDLEQLLHLLSEGGGPKSRCSKARAMFAMRACRKSVMIGKALTKAQMTTLLRNMGTIDQPWNCPHGRPTMRHLVNLEQHKSRMGSSRIDWVKWAASQ
ncbi:hypothetical protein TREMEDRAFT_25119, partial [Tremella mesenterica DSM 1558]|uniref:uncharacterized protein n=1 Tax=Tremella mesenterica (strain ATCC 24925 / CBS 8224 / DSM 1558 / NBRC 9311 / NRRL Y-6157 / RJB 2259-6 / UBC 559-6) TaxID=578456 RepID=UPI0003F48CE5